jgi:uncharacterized protein (DUF1778 family)
MVVDQLESKDTMPVTLSENDSLRVLALLENPPAPTARLVRAARILAEFGMDRPE